MYFDTLREETVSYYKVLLRAHAQGFLNIEKLPPLTSDEWKEIAVSGELDYFRRMFLKVDELCKAYVRQIDAIGNFDK